ncbi:MAG TPA: hypothetical protein VE967_08710 [Gemmatimonadaceae bacterium]|nr:hypothetical protein [Gemmatimonadaceae bacterium]
MSNESNQDLHNKGWGFALFIIVLAVVINMGVLYIHKTTYLAPPKTAAKAETHQTH